MGVGGSEWKWVEVGGSGWEHGLVKHIIKYAWICLEKIKIPNTN